MDEETIIVEGENEEVIVDAPEEINEEIVVEAEPEVLEVGSPE